jgi:rsbT co-antagonist protein RsbR
MVTPETPFHGEHGEIVVSNERVERILEIFASVTAGDYSQTVEVSEEEEDDFTPVEVSTNFMIEQLVYEREQNETRQAELERNLDTILKQRQAIEELSTPIIKIWERVLVLPLIGSLDTRRSQNLTDALLTTIAATQTKVAILDITGVAGVDSAVANHLLKTVSSVKLLGAQCVITGIRPEVAQTIVHLGVELTDVRTLSDLAAGLKWALDYLNLEIREKRAAQKKPNGTNGK